MNRKVPVSVTVLTLNEEMNIERCLRSVTWADEIVVVDSYSEDDTVEIAKRYTDRVIQREFKDFEDQRSYSVSLCTNDWVMALDADESVTPALRDEILSALEKGERDGYYIPLALYFLGGWLKHGASSPGYKIRLYRKSHGRWEGMIHEKVVLGGRYGFLRNPVLHLSNTRSDVNSWIRKTLFYTDLQFSSLEEKPEQTLLSLLMRAPKAFLWAYIEHGGFLDGARGFVMSLLLFVNEAVLTARIWEKFYMKPDPQEPPAYRLTLRVRAIRLVRRMKDSSAARRGI